MVSRTPNSSFLLSSSEATRLVASQKLLLASAEEGLDSKILKYQYKKKDKKTEKEIEKKCARRHMKQTLPSCLFVRFLHAEKRERKALKRRLRAEKKIRKEERARRKEAQAQEGRDNARDDRHTIAIADPTPSSYSEASRNGKDPAHTSAGRSKGHQHGQTDKRSDTSRVTQDARERLPSQEVAARGRGRPRKKVQQSLIQAARSSLRMRFSSSRLRCIRSSWMPRISLERSSSSAPLREKTLQSTMVPSIPGGQ